MDETERAAATAAHRARMSKPLERPAESPWRDTEPVCMVSVSFWRGKERAQGPEEYREVIYCSGIGPEHPEGLGWPMPATGMGYQTLGDVAHFHLNPHVPDALSRAMMLAEQQPHEPIEYSRKGKRIYWHGTRCRTCRDFVEQAHREFGFKMEDGKVFVFDGEWKRHVTG